MEINARYASLYEARVMKKFKSKRQTEAFMLPVDEVVRAHDVVHGRRRPNGCMAWRANGGYGLYWNRSLCSIPEVVLFSNHFELGIGHLFKEYKGELELC